MRGRRRLGDARAALWTGVAGPHGLDDAILRGRHVEAAGAVLADPNHQAAAAGTGETRGLDHALDAPQMGGKGARGAAGSLPRRRTSGAARAIILTFLNFGDRDLNIFQNELQLIRIELLRTLAEPRAFIFLDEQLQTLDRLLRRRELALDVKARDEFVLGADAFGFKHGALRFEQCAQIGRQLCKSGGIEARHHVGESIASEALNEAKVAINSPRSASPRSARRRVSSLLRQIALRTGPDSIAGRRR